MQKHGVADLEARSYAIVGYCWLSSEVAFEEDAIGLIVLHACHKEVKTKDDTAQPVYDLTRQLQRSPSSCQGVISDASILETEQGAESQSLSSDRCF